MGKNKGKRGVVNKPQAAAAGLHVAMQVEPKPATSDHDTVKYDRWGVYLGTLALVVSVVSGYFAYQANRTSQRQADLMARQLDPQVVVSRLFNGWECVNEAPQGDVASHLRRSLGKHVGITIRNTGAPVIIDRVALVIDDAHSSVFTKAREWVPFPKHVSRFVPGTEWGHLPLAPFATKNGASAPYKLGLQEGLTFYFDCDDVASEVDALLKEGRPINDVRGSLVVMYSTGKLEWFELDSLDPMSNDRIKWSGKVNEAFALSVYERALSRNERLPFPQDQLDHVYGAHVFYGEARKAALQPTTPSGSP